MVPTTLEAPARTHHTSSRGRPSSSAGACAVGVASVLAATRRARKGPRSATGQTSRGKVTSLASKNDDFLDVVVVGGGVSGLTAAHRILKDRPESSVVVTEARDRAGGNITTMSANGRLWEEGPNSFQPGDAILTVACDIGLQDDIMLADPNSYRFVWWEGSLRALPATPQDAVLGNFLTWPGKIRAGLGAVGIKEPMPEKEESVKEFVTRNLGEEAFERLIDPFVSGVYAGDPSTLSAEAATGRVQVLEKNAGSLVAGAIKLFQDRASKPSEPRDPRLPEVKGQTVGSFRNGLKQFSDALCDDVAKHGSPVRLNWKLTKLAYDKQTGVHVLDYDTPEGPKQLRSKALILTAPSYVAAPLLKEVCSPAAEALEGIRYPRVAAVTVEYHKSAFREPAHGKGVVNGFGQLHPRSQGIRTLGTIYSSSLFPNRMPDDDKIMLLHYIGGARDPELFGGIQDLSEGQLVEATHKDTVQTMLHESEASRLPKALGVRVWDRAIPQLEVGHQKRLDTVKETLAAEGVKGVYLAGNYVGGVALGRCVEFGIEIAKEVVDFVKEAKISQPA